MLARILWLLCFDHDPKGPVNRVCFQIVIYHFHGMALFPVCVFFVVHTRMLAMALLRCCRVPVSSFFLQAFARYAELVPIWVWLLWIPQLISSLPRVEGQTAKAILFRVCLVCVVICCCLVVVPVSSSCSRWTCLSWFCIVSCVGAVLVALFVWFFVRVAS